MVSESDRVEGLANWYLEEQLDFDKRLIRFRYQMLKTNLFGTRGLELGPAEGQMTRFLLQDFTSLTVVDAASELLGSIPEAPNLLKIHSLFEDFHPEDLFDSIIMEHILEHVDKPVDLLKRVRDWLVPEGRLFIGVPNGNSIHRLAAVKMGLLDHPCQLNERDYKVGHRRVYTPETLRKDNERSGLIIEKINGVFFKPLSNQQIQDDWTDEMIEGFFELGKDFPEYSSDIQAVCKI
jgi:2-polyprenyl-3-methyl-5-hydroxy-6-metoxy-1,4-benzoquinol methylase